MKPEPFRGSQEIMALRNRCESLEERLTQVEQRLNMLEPLHDALEQMHTVLEADGGPVPIPIFLRWRETEENGCRVARVAFGRYLAEVVNGLSAVTWVVFEGPRHRDKWAACGGGYTSFQRGKDEAEAALQELVRTDRRKTP